VGHLPDALHHRLVASLALAYPTAEPRRRRQVKAGALAALRKTPDYFKASGNKCPTISSSFQSSRTSSSDIITLLAPKEGHFAFSRRFASVGKGPNGKRVRACGRAKQLALDLRLVNLHYVAVNMAGWLAWLLDLPRDVPAAPASPSFQSRHRFLAFSSLEPHTIHVFFSRE
jgi:hypothetical protein